MPDRLNTTAKDRQNLDSTFKVSRLKSHGFGVQPRSDESVLATKVQLWESYQQAKHLNQIGTMMSPVPVVPIQRKLTIGKSEDKYERKVDSISFPSSLNSTDRNESIQRQNRPNSTQVTWNDISARIQNTSRGREALQIKNQYNVDIVWNTGIHAASFSPDTKKCSLNPNQALDVVVAYFVHEMYHAQVFHTNQMPDATKLDEDTFVKKLIDEEIIGTSKQFELKLELNTLGTSSDLRDAELAYLSAYRYKKNQSLASGKSAQEAHQEGINNGRSRVGFMIRADGNSAPIIGPAPNVRYSEFYSREWRRTNRSIRH
jgi:hypothetical protein